MMDLENKNIPTEKELFTTKKEPRKALQTFLRNQNKFQINAANIIDRKAAIMIRINSTIISAVVIFSNRIDQVPNGSYISIALVATCFVSLMCALNASRPHYFDSLFTFRKTVKKRKLKPEETLFITGASADLSLEEYEEAFHKIVKNQHLQIGNQVRALHLFEKRVRRSFAHIELAYISFMIGFVTTVLLFLLGYCHLSA